MENRKTMNRWIIVIGAILIQLSLGAIYAWSVFTPKLVAPLPDDTFPSILEDGGIVIEMEGGLSVGEDNRIVLTFKGENLTITDLENVTVILELRNEDNEIVKNHKYFPFTESVIKEGKEIRAGPYTPDLEGESYVFNTGEDENGKKRINNAGNWHYLISANRSADGTTYSFDVLEQVGTGDFGFSKTQTQIVFSVGLFVFALFTIIGGRLAARFGPRNIAILGGSILGAGYIIGSLVGASFIGLVLSIGLLGGAGIGLAYVVPIGVGVKWFPDKKGLISGLAVAGFGFGALLWVKLCTGFKFGPVNLSGSWEGLYGIFSVSEVFMVYGIAFLLTVIVGGFIMRNPPEGWKPKGWEPPVEGDKKATGAVEFTSKEMRKTPQYYMLFAMFTFGALAGLMVIGIIKLFGIYALQDSGVSYGEASIIAGTAMALFFSLSNGIGRIAWGAISDRIGRRLSFVIMFTIQGVMMILFYFIGGNEYLLYLGAAVIGFNFGGNFALFPAATADFFGNKTVGQNYGWVFFAYGIGGIVGPILGGLMGDLELWLWAFVPAGIALLIAAGIALALKPPKKRD